ncbi:MAG: acetyl-CoA carboxylase biotin carboxyl carrier protein [Proteobacteria bacterium]|nr:acetyl-CoA carboxylase biotin carboxyl carrier protein [Pseudomonadota bacterium]
MANEDVNKTEGRAQSLAEVRALARILRQYDLSELEVETDEGRVRLKRSSGAARVQPAVAAVAIDDAAGVATSGAGERSRGTNASPEVAAKTITSPFVGTFYRAASPDAAPYVEVGQTVRRGQTLCIIEAMKLMNEIEAERDARILEVLVNSGDSVEFGQALFRVDGA